jgi:predicted ATPase
VPGSPAISIRCAQECLRGHTNVFVLLDRQLVLLSGEAGIGKSLLTAALLERIATEPHTRLRYFCSPQHTDSALYSLAHDDKPQQPEKTLAEEKQERGRSGCAVERA